MITCLRTIVIAVGLSLAGGISAAEPPRYGLAADNRIHAQTLMNELLTQYPELVTAGIHCVPPGGTQQMIIASTLNVIGKKSDPEDVDVAARGFSQVVPNLKLGKLGVMLPLRDRSGKDIGALGLAFKYRAGQDQVALFAKATEIRDQLAPKIGDVAELFVLDR